jgi:alkylation response protein AidB-like acyl-CoA dehydrogenase
MLYITDAPVADVMLVFASHVGAPEHAGISAFLVHKKTPGFTVSGRPGKTRQGASPLYEVVLTDCLIPSGKRLGQEGAGMDIFNSSMDLERGCTLASALGDMRRHLETCVGYAQARKQFGRAIGKFPNVADRLADMYLRLEAARLLVYQAAWLSQQGKLACAETAAAKLFTSEAWVHPAWTRSRSTGAAATWRKPGSGATCAMRLPAREQRESSVTPCRGCCACEPASTAAGQ